MIRFGRRFVVLLALAGVGTLAALSISTSLALFSSTGSQQVSNFTAGTVTLTSTSGSTCTASEAGSCKYAISYTGTLSAWIGLTVTSEGVSASGYHIVDSDTSSRFPAGVDEIVGGGIVGTGFTDTFTITFSTNPASGALVTLSAIAVQSAHNTKYVSSVATGPISWT